MGNNSLFAEMTQLMTCYILVKKPDIKNNVFVCLSFKKNYFFIFEKFTKAIKLLIYLTRS